MKKRVVIVGAGVAGLTAAKKLEESGQFELTLLEAQDRIGGRVWTKPIGNHYVEGGAQFIMGEDQNPIYLLAKSHNLIEAKEEQDEKKFEAVLLFKNIKNH